MGFSKNFSSTLVDNFFEILIQGLLKSNRIISTINIIDLVDLDSNGKIRDSIIENYILLLLKKRIIWILMN